MLFRERQQIIILALAGMMVCGFLLLRHRPLSAQMKSVEQARTVQMVAIAKASARSRQLPVFREQLLKFRNTVGNYEAKVTDNRDLGAFMQQITNLMNKHRLTEQFMRPGEEIEAEQFNCIPINMRCRGSLKNLFGFFESLRGLDRLVRIEHVDLVNESDFSGDVTMSADTVIYYRPGSRAK